MTRFCPTCGTEIDESALFCPSCGQPIAPLAEVDPAPAPPPPSAPDPTPENARTEAHPEAPAPEPAAPPLPPPPPAPAARTPGPGPGTAGGNRSSVPVTWPVMLSGWLIGGGAAVGAVGCVIGLFGGFLNPVDLLLLVALLLIAATVFFSASVPAIPQLRLVTLVVVLIGFGIALDRIGFGRAGVGTLLVFLGTAAAAIGAVILELGRDQPVGGFGS